MLNFQFIIFCVILLGVKANIENQPQLSVVDNNVHFRVPSTGYMMFTASSLKVNNIDLIPTLEEAQNAIKLLRNYELFISQYQFKMDDIESKLVNIGYRPGGNATNATVDASLLATRIFRLNRRLFRLQTSLQSLQLLLNENECATNPCKNGAVCLDMFNGFLCQCPTGWEGTTCENDINECARFIGTDLGCQNGASCLNLPGTYQCQCPVGWIGIHCNRKPSDCNSGGPEICGHGTCIPQNNGVGYKCICDQGWTTDGTHLTCSQDVDECKQNHPPCSTNPLVQCINLPGTFMCQHCPPGYTGNGYYCADINECELFNGGCSVSPYVECENTPGSKKCGPCPAGYEGDGKTCTYKGVCNINNGGCNFLATCVNNPAIAETNVQCICPAGYTGSGIGPMGCVRTPSFVCSPNPCVHGTCIPNNSTQGFECICDSEFSGIYCNRRNDPCTSNPCLNGATCVKRQQRFECLCASGFAGRFCQREQQACGDIFEVTNGTINYPPSDYISYRRSEGLSCTWTIKTEEDKVVEVNFTRFNLAPSCGTQWLQVHDGRNNLAPILGKFCGNTLPFNGSFVSTHNVVYLWLRTDGQSGLQPAFKLSWRTRNPVCGGKITGNRGFIVSPGWPSNYPNNRNCFWRFSLPVEKRLSFHVYSMSIGQNVDCTSDYLEFYSDWVSTTRKKEIFEKLCNSTIPGSFYSLSHSGYVHFKSNEKDNYAGFQIGYIVENAIQGCGGTYTNRDGYIQSIIMTSSMPSKLVCEYEIKLSANTTIELEILELDMEDNCDETSVAIYQELASDAALIGRYCGRKPPGLIVTYGNSIIIKSETNYLQKGHWKMRYKTVCHQMFSKPNDTITNSESNTDCLYLIAQPPGSIIFLELVMYVPTRLSVQPMWYSEILVFDGDNENATLLGKYRSKAMVESSANYLLIKTVKNSFAPVPLFTATYTTVNLGCGGLLKDDKIPISYPPHGENQYSSTKKCKWIIMAPPGNIVQLTWTIFNLEQSSDCTYDNVQVFDNNTGPGMGGLVGKYCGYSLPPTTLSSSNLMTISFVSGNTKNGDRFSVSYTFIKEDKVCGGNYFTSAGVLKSPGNPQYYPNRECVWTITVPLDSQIMLKFINFSLESHYDCIYDWLELRNGGTSSSPFIGKYCGTTYPKTITSHTNKLYLKFHSDGAVNKGGFRIEWSSAATGCGGTLTSPSGSITSPLYPEPSSKRTDCVWKIIVSAGSKIQIIFADIDLEKQSSCLYGYLQVFDGSTLNSNSLGKFCSSQTKPVISTSNNILVRFDSGVNLNARGFSLQYSTICINKMKGFRGVIESPNFPNAYPQDQNCVWDISVSQGNKINISFSDFALERSYILENKSCRLDYVEIEYSVATQYSDEEDEPRWQKYGRYCGDQNPGLITIPSNQAKIHFVSDDYLMGAGFRLEWQLFGCGGILTRTAGVIQSPNYPKPYPSNIQCNWLITVPLGRSISIKFKEIDVEKDSSCRYDYVEVFNGRDETYQQIAKFCHQLNPIIITSTGNNMFVTYKSDYNYESRGFIATYSTAPTTCGGKMTAPEGFIFSPNYPENFNKNETCEWLIQTDDNHAIEIKFVDVDLPNVGSCNNTYIKVYDGPSQAYPVLERICGSSKDFRHTIRSTSKNMFIEFKSESFFTSKGFKAHYWKACGAKIKTSGSGQIQLSKLFDFTHQNFGEANCSFTIESEDLSKHVTLTITKFDLGSSLWCGEESKVLKIFDGYFSDSALVGSYCPPKLPAPIISDGSALRIEVYKQLDLYATYSVLGDPECGGDLQSQEGYLATPGWPKSYPRNIQCVWFISMGPGNSISLTFNELDIPESEKCNSDFVEIREINETGKLLNVFCGKKTPPTISVVGTLYILFKSTQLEEGTESTHKGFIAEYAFSNDNHLNGSEGYVSNPGYPSPLVSSLVKSYFWTITTNASTVIELTFIDFTLNTCSMLDCYANQLKVYDGMDSTFTLLKKLCCFNTPNSIITTSNMMYISFDVYNSRMDIKFLLKWKEIPKKQLQTKQPKSECQYFSKLEGQTVVNITSPGYPHRYAPDLHCEWVYEINPQYHLAIEFKYLDFGKSQDSYECRYTDTLKVYTKREKNSEWELLRVLCDSTNLDGRIAASSLLKVEFDSNQYLNGNGFEGSVYGVCGGSLTGPSGKIEFDKDHAHANTCQWNITVRPGRTIKLEFDHFDLSPNDPTGCKNFLLIRNGMFPDSPFLGDGKFCGPVAPPELESTSNHVYLKYSGRSNIQGFKIRYTEISFDCGQEFRLSSDETSVEISSPNYPNIPQHHIECIWRFRAPAGEAIRVDFEDRFDISRDYKCATDYLELRDGGTDLSPLIGRFCDATPSTKFSTDNMLTIKYFTDSDEPRNGFKAKVSLSYCGGTIRGKGSINTKEPHAIRAGSNCTWYLKASPNQYIVMNFPVFRIAQHTRNCSWNVGKVIIFERSLIHDITEDKQLGIFCGLFNTTEIRSTTNTVVVNYLAKSDQDEFRLEFRSEDEECGGTLVQETGTITSPGYPSNCFRNQLCSWNIQVPKGRRISIFIDDLDVDTASTIIYIYNGYSLGPVIAGPRNIQAQQTYETSDNKAQIFYWQIYSSNKRGFKMTFSSEKQSVCTYNFNTTSGLILVPEISSPYICEYEHTKILDEETLVLNIVLETNRTEKYINKRCVQNLVGISIYSRSKIIGDACQNTTNKPLIIRSTHSLTKLVVFKYLYTSLNYTIYFKTYKCGGILRNNMGNIFSPNFPNTPSNSVECSWIITLEDSARIKINITTFDLGEDCEKSSLVIYNGKTTYDPTIGTYCGNYKPDVITSQKNYLLIEYRYEKGSNNPTKGFNLNYESEQRGCGGLYQIDNHFIESPNYGKGYGNNEECVWRVQAEEGNMIKLNFFDRFYIEESNNCTKDYVEVFDWKGEQWVSLGRKCGRNLPQGITSSDKQLKILFRSNEKITGTGFRASWSWHCGGVLEADRKERYLMSPYYPHSLLHRSNCTYKIETKSPNGIFILKFLDFDLGTDADSNCRLANLTIDRRRLGMKQVFCGKVISQYQRYSDTMFITFMSAANRYSTASGFKLAYKDESCGGNINAPTILETRRSDVRTLARVMRLYEPQIKCTWYVTAPSDQLVVLSIHKLRMTIGALCYLPSLNVYDGPEAIKTKKLASLCGNLQDPTPIPSKSNQMVVTLDVHPSDLEGFQGEVYFTYGPSVGCGGTINLTETKQIKSPNNLPHMECHWIIIAPQDYKVQLEFKDISNSTSCINPIRNHTDYCTCSYVEVRDGGGPFADQIARLCNSDNNSVRTFTTSWNTAYVILYSAVPQNDMFKLTLVPIRSKCGSSILTATKGFQELTSPNYPNNYPEEIKCTWVLQRSSPGRIMILFEDFDLPEESPAKSCDTDRLELLEDSNHRIITEGLGPAATYISRSVYMRASEAFKYRFCGNDTKPFDYYSTENKVTLTFYSKLGNGRKGRGFKLKYTTSGCNRTIYANEGNIQNEYPNNEPNCVITITADPNRFISIYFMDFGLVYMGLADFNCSKNGLEIYENNSTGLQLLEACGDELPNPIFSKSNQIYIRAYHSLRQTILRYKFLFLSSDKAEGCGGKLFNNEGLFSSPMYPNPHRKDIECTWDVMVPKGSKVNLIFTDFNIGGGCTSNRVVVTTYKEGLGTYHQFCAEDIPAPLYSDDAIKVQYYSTVHNGGTGWLAKFETIKTLGYS